MKKQNPEMDIFKYKRIRDIRVGIDYPPSRWTEWREFVLTLETPTQGYLTNKDGNRNVILLKDGDGMKDTVELEMWVCRMNSLLSQ